MSFYQLLLLFAIFHFSQHIFANNSEFVKENSIFIIGFGKIYHLMRYTDLYAQ